jgi:subtilase family serine protease
MISKRVARLATASVLAIAAAAFARPAAALAGNVPASVKMAKDLGASDTAQMINITVHLALPNKALFDRTVDALYQRGSPTFHKWLTDAQLKSFAPPASQMAAVRATLENYGLSIISTDKNGFSVRARGTLGNVARAFNTEIHDFTLNGKTFRANVTEAVLAGSAASYVHAVAGIESHTIRPLATRAVNFKTGAARAAVPLAKVAADGGLSSIITDKAISVATTFDFTTPGASLPTATYTGQVYDANPALIVSFTPAQLESAYNLTAAYSAGLNGAGQTIVLLEGYGYPTNESDANAFFKLTSLPLLTSSNFKIVYPEGKPSNPDIGVLEGWDIEIALDTQSSHSVAPGANIVVVATNGQDSEDFQQSMTYIIDNALGYTVSDSWEEDQDIASGPDEQTSYEDILEKAAAKGISFQFSTGDGGDGGIGTPVGAPGVPSVAPHAVAVGGTAILNKAGSTTSFYPVGWGNSYARIAADGPVVYPAATDTFYAGGGGGESVYWPKPSWQSSLPGSGRQTPDVSALADPFTGVPIVVTESGEQVV